MEIPKFIAKIATKRAAKKIMKKAPDYVSKLANTSGASMFMETRPKMQQLSSTHENIMPDGSSNLRTASKKEIKDKLTKRTEEAKKKVAKGSNNDFTKAEASYTKKDIRIEARNIKRAGLDGPKRTGPIKKQISVDAKGLLNMVKSEKGKDVVKERFGYTQMPDGSSITRKCSYNSKRKK